MKKIITLLSLSIIFIGTAFALGVDENELRSTQNQTIEFINYTGPHRVIDSLAAIKAIGTNLGVPIARNVESPSSTGNRAKYYVVHAVDPNESGKLDADILYLGSDAAVDHIVNLRRIIGAYLVAAYGYSERDAETIAVFVTVYNAVYRGKFDVFDSKYKKVVMDNLSKEKCGLGVNWQDWAGKSEIVIPLFDVSGGLSTVDTSVISDTKVVKSMQEEDDKNIDTRKDMVDIKEREADNASEKAKESQKKATDEQKKLDEEKQKSEEAQKKADEAQKKKDEAQKKADEAQKKIDEAQKKADEAQKKIDEAQKKAEEAQKKAEEAQKKAQEAQKKAEEQPDNEDAQKEAAKAQEAQKKAEEAQKKAIEEQEKAIEAQKKATEAQKEATKAQKEATEAQKKATEEQKDAQKKLDNQKEAEKEQEKKTDSAKEEAKKAQELADKKSTEARNDRKEIAKDQKELQDKEAAEANLSTDIGLALVDETALTSRLVKFNTENGETLKDSPVTTIRNRTAYKCTDGYIAIAGEDNAKSAVRLVIIDEYNMEVIDESNEIVSENSVLVQDGESYYCVVKSGNSWVVAKYNDSLKIQLKSSLAVKDATPIMITESGIVVTDANGKVKVLSKDNLNPIK